MIQPQLRWIVDADGVALGALLERMPAQAVALGEGRVFVDGQRALDAARVLVRGSVVEVFAERRADTGVRILAEHAGLVAAYKPALLATEPDRAGSRLTLLSAVSGLLRCPPNQLHALSRLDVGVSGVVLLARRSGRSRVEPARAHLRRYVAIAEAAPEPARGSWTSAIARDQRGPRSAETRYAVVRQLTEQAGSLVRGDDRPLAPALLALQPISGRSHQLRIHAARAGAALLGDRAHGGLSRLLEHGGGVVELGRIALHALSCEV
ncbi:MAG TPA: pseudouridine synthase, partial [Polyangiales bacterium]|nr:pseudouridine synthase [Polyangiales bacterium]